MHLPSLHPGCLHASNFFYNCFEWIMCFSFSAPQFYAKILHIVTTQDFTLSYNDAEHSLKVRHYKYKNLCEKSCQMIIIDKLMLILTERQYLFMGHQLSFEKCSSQTWQMKMTAYAWPQEWKKTDQTLTLVIELKMLPVHQMPKQHTEHRLKSEELS